MRSGEIAHGGFGVRGLNVVTLLSELVVNGALEGVRGRVGPMVVASCDCSRCSCVGCHDLPPEEDRLPVDNATDFHNRATS